MVTLLGVFWGDLLRSDVWDMTKWLKSQHLLHNILQELLNLFPDVAKESFAWPPALEHDGVDGDFLEIHFHCCPPSKRVSAYFARLEAQMSASNCGTDWLQVLKDIFGGVMFHATILPDGAHRSIQWCAWIYPDSVHKTCPLKYGAQSTGTGSSMNDGVIFLIIFLHFEYNSHAIILFQVVRLWGMRRPYLKKWMFLRHKSF